MRRSLYGDNRLVLDPDLVNRNDNGARRLSPLPEPSSWQFFLVHVAAVGTRQPCRIGMLCTMMRWARH